MRIYVFCNSFLPDTRNFRANFSTSLQFTAPVFALRCRRFSAVHRTVFDRIFRKIILSFDSFFRASFALVFFRLSSATRVILSSPLLVSTFLIALAARGFLFTTISFVLIFPTACCAFSDGFFQTLLLFLFRANIVTDIGKR